MCSLAPHPLHGPSVSVQGYHLLLALLSWPAWFTGMSATEKRVFLALLLLCKNISIEDSLGFNFKVTAWWCIWRSGGPLKCRCSFRMQERSPSFNILETNITKCISSSQTLGVDVFRKSSTQVKVLCAYISFSNCISSYWYKIFLWWFPPLITKDTERQ